MSERTFVYAIGTEGGPIKVGITGNIFSRLRALQNGSARKLELIWSYTAHNREWALEMERFFHEEFSDKRLEGEWFAVSAEEAFWGLDGQVRFGQGPFTDHWHELAKGWHRFSVSNGGKGYGE